MKIRRFFAKDMRTALANVTSELGAEAAILSSTKVNGGVEVVAATDYEESLLHKPSSNSQANNGQSKASKPSSYSEPVDSLDDLDDVTVTLSSQRESNKSKVHQSKSLIESLLGQSKRSQSSSERLSSREDESSRLRATNNQATSSRGTKSIDNNYVDQNSGWPEEEQRFPSFPKVEWTQEPTLVAMREELNMLRSLLQDQVAKIADDKRLQESPTAVALEREMVKLGLDKPIIQSIIGQCDAEKDYECAWQKGLALLAKSIRVNEDEILTRGGVVALVGPTGVGKTTTIAKLAAKQVLKEGANSVALITTDNFRVAAHEQLRTYGRILQVPVRAVDDEKSFREALYHFSDKKLVLIDTAGMSHHDERMAQLMEVLSNDTVEIKNYLVLSATSQRQVLVEAIELFKQFKLEGSIITKIDEAVSLGEAISTILSHNLPVAYTTDGQRVPEDIRVARAHHLVSKMVWLSRQHENQWSKQATGTR
ncbi:MAG: flagellar biosynthesis protein FlhF [Gammaproteobacteria bacterium]|nr:flagellar biosynthesis protein FlhF [Gammaproteobacteria bacterium]